MVDPIAGGIISGFAQVHWCRISGEIIEAEDRTGVRLVGGAGNGLYRSFRNFFCDSPPAPAPPGVFEPPFTGGQCQKQYDVFARVRTIQDGQPDGIVEGTVRLFGPISAVFIRRPDAFSWNIVVRHGVAGSPGATVESVTGGGTFFRQPNEARIEQVTTTPVDGIDNCGNAPPVLPPAGDDYYSDDFTVNVNSGGNSFNFPITITSNPQPPTLDDDGDLSVPITITFPDNGGTSIDIDIGIDGDIDVTGTNPPAAPNPNNPPQPPGGGGGGGGPTDPNDFETDTEPPPAPPGVEEPPEEPTNLTAIRGAIVTCTNAAQLGGVTKIFQDGGVPDVYVPYLGLLSFYVKTAEGDGAWTADIPIKNERQWVTCDWPGGAADVRVSARGDAILRVTPVSYKLEE